ncbi:MAG: DUF3021 domain-containing protein [Oscillospiraceae bacterium]|nr:DUF3021 domain-containing protein [Oscillospiraceae bacterium]
MKINSSALIQSALTGMGIGFPVTLVCMASIGGFNGVIQEFAVWMVASALFGILSGVLFYSKHDLAFPAALGLHLVGCFAVTVIACAIIGYGNDLLELIISILPGFLTIYAVIYGVCFAIMKHHEKQINEALRNN